MGEPIFRIENVSKGFGNHVVLDDVSLDIHAGDIIGVIGASGAGKSTFLHTLIGFLKPDKGDILFHLPPFIPTSCTILYTMSDHRHLFLQQSFICPCRPKSLGSTKHFRAKGRDKTKETLNAPFLLLLLLLFVRPTDNGWDLNIRPVRQRNEEHVILYTLSNCFVSGWETWKIVIIGA